MADAEQYYQGLSDEHKRLYFSQRYFTEKVAALEAKIAELQSRLSGNAPVEAHQNGATQNEAPQNVALAAAQQKITALEARIAELEQKGAPVEDVKEEVKEDTKQAARKTTKARKKDAADSSDADS